MKLLEKYSCIFCKYRKLNKNHDYACMDSWEKDESGYPIGKCNSLSNIYYGKIVELFPFKQRFTYKYPFLFLLCRLIEPFILFPALLSRSNDLTLP